jgi:hypothetical protein
MTAKEHNKTLGILFLVYTGLQAFGAILGFFMMIGMLGYFVSGARGRDTAPLVTMMVVFICAMFFAIVLLIPSLVAGLKMWKGKMSGRTWGIIAAIIALLNIPLGTALGIYALWFLFGEEGKNFYLGGGNPNMLSSQPPPPPQSWQ